MEIRTLEKHVNTFSQSDQRLVIRCSAVVIDGCRAVGTQYNIKYST